MLNEVLQNKWVRAVGALGALVGISMVLYLLSSVLVPLFFAFIVAYIFDPVIDKIETYKISRVGAIVTLVGGLLIAGIILPLIILPSVIRQANSMTKSPTQETQRGETAKTVEEVYFQGKMAQKVEEWLELDSLVQTAGWDETNGVYNKGTEDLNALATIRSVIGSGISDNTRGLLQSQFPKLTKAAGTSILRMIPIIGDIFLGLFLFLGNFVLFAFVAIYLLKDYDDIVAYGDGLVPHRHQAKVREIMSQIDGQLRAFLRGQVMVCCCLGTMYAVGLSISGAPFALLLALFGALASFVPFLGLVLTLGPAVILTVLYYGGLDWHVGGVLATFAVAQFLEGNFLTPKIVGSQVGLGPVWVILAIMIFSSALGFVGLLLAVPIAAVLKVLTEEGLKHYRASTFFAAESSESP